MKLLWMEIENFKGIARFRLDLGGKSATVFGANGAGKSTLCDALSYLLYGKDWAGRADFAVKPLGPDGQPMIRGAQTRVRAALETEDGAALTLQRAYSEKWERRRGSAQAEMTGHTTAFEVDGLPVKAGEFRALVEEKIGPEAVFRALSCPEYFCAHLPWQERRRVLSQMAGAVSAEEIFAQNPALLPLRDALQGHSAEDYRKIQERRRAALAKELDGLPARIDEAQRAEIPLTGDPEAARAEETRLRQERQALSDALARGRDGELENAERALIEKRAEVAELIAGNDRYRARAGETLRRQARERAAPLRTRLDRIRAEAARLRAESDGQRALADKLARRLAALRRDYAATAAEIAPRQADACPACGRPYDPQSLEQARRAAAREQRDRLRDLAELGRRRAEELREARCAAASLAAQAEAREAACRGLEAELAALEAPPEVPDCEGYAAGLAALQSEQRALEARAAELKRDRAAAESEARERIAALDEKIRACASLRMQAEANERARARVRELLERQKEIAAALEEAEAQIALCEGYVRALAALTEARVDGQFRRIRWKLFAEQINGGLNETCAATVDGVPFADLNRAMRTNAGLDAIAALIHFFGKTAPVFVDNAEGVTALDAVPGQRIRLAVSAADAELRVETEDQTWD